MLCFSWFFKNAMFLARVLFVPPDTCPLAARYVIVLCLALFSSLFCTCSVFVHHTCPCTHSLLDFVLFLLFVLFVIRSLRMFAVIVWPWHMLGGG